MRRDVSRKEGRLDGLDSGGVLVMKNKILAFLMAFTFPIWGIPVGMFFWFREMYEGFLDWLDEA
jgi:hypothetical protein